MEKGISRFYARKELSFYFKGFLKRCVSLSHLYGINPPLIYLTRYLICNNPIPPGFL